MFRVHTAIRQTRYFERLDRIFGDPRRAPVPQQRFDSPLTVLGFFNRCGSTLLGEYLCGTGTFSGFKEPLNLEQLEPYRANHPKASLADYMYHYYEKHGAENTYLGTKAQWSQLMGLHLHKVLHLFNGLWVIHLTREDLLAQAVSLHIATYYSAWTSNFPIEKEEPPPLDPAQLDSYMYSIQEHNLFTRQTALALGARYYHLTYENLLEHPQRELEKLGDFFNLDTSNWRIKEPSIKIQRNELNEQHSRYYQQTLQNAIYSEPG